MAGKKILVADDSLTIQKVIRLALSGDGYEIQTVSDGKEAVEQASLFRPDICIVDVSLPHLDAYQIREHFLQKPDLRSVPVILMSSAFEKVDEDRAKKLGFAGHLIKPFDPSHLRSTLLAVAQQTPAQDPIAASISSPISPSITLEPPPMTSDLPIVNPVMDDVQQMAQNTFEMSGMSQHEWGMFELGKAPTEAKTETQPAVDPFFSHTLPSSSVPEPTAHEVVSIDFNSVPQSSGYSSASSPHQFSVSPQELESMIKTEVARVLEQMQTKIQDRLEHDLAQFTQASLPQMAEKIIKDEIHKLLSEPPL